MAGERMYSEAEVRAEHERGRCEGRRLERLEIADALERQAVKMPADLADVIDAAASAIRAR